jgi:hypothetical protein
MSRALRSGEAEIWTEPLRLVHIARLLSVSKQFRARYLSLVRRSSINIDWAMLKLTVDSPGDTHEPNDWRTGASSGANLILTSKCKARSLFVRTFVSFGRLLFRLIFCSPPTMSFAVFEVSVLKILCCKSHDPR